jgi:hypothetical protein
MMPRVDRNPEARGGPPRKKGGTGEDPKVGLNLTVRNSTALSTLGIHSPSRRSPYYKDSNAAQVKMKCWDTLRGHDPTEKQVTFYKLDFGRQNLRQIYLIVNDVLEKVMMWNATIPNERELYKMAYETILEISEPTTIQDFNAYKQSLSRGSQGPGPPGREVEDSGSTGSLDPWSVSNMEMM